MAPAPRSAPSAVGGDREAVLQALAEQLGRSSDARLIGPGHHPGRRAVVGPERSHQPRAAPEAPGDLGALIQKSEKGAAGAAEAGEHTAALGALGEQACIGVAPDLRPGPDEHGDLTPGGRRLRLTRRHKITSPLKDLRTRILEAFGDRQAELAGAGAKDRSAIPIPVEPMHERFGPGADHSRHPHRRGPVVVVPPDPFAVAELVLGGANRRLDPVHVEEPVAGAAVRPPAGDAVDRLDEAAAVPGLDLGASVKEAEDGVGLGDRVPLVDQNLGAEVATHGQLDLAGVLAWPDPAAGGRRAQSATATAVPRAGLTSSCPSSRPSSPP